MHSESTTKPSVFVGSSVESLDVAYAIQENLEHAAEVTVWTQGVFELSRISIQALMKAVETFDFAVFVFAADDVVKMRSKSLKTARDNVVFELGLFIGGLGEDRAFIIHPRGLDLHLPTDLAGITPATYETNRRDNNLTAALGPACTKIKRAIELSGQRQSSSQSATLSTPVAAGLSEELRNEVAQMVSDQGNRIRKAFERFEQRVTSMIEAQQVTAKAPISRLSNLIRKELSPGARRLLKQVASNRHLTSEEYLKLGKTKYSRFINELRDENLLVPLTGFNTSGERIPVYWLPPGSKQTVQNIISELPTDDAEAAEALRKTLARIGYSLPAN